MVPLLSPRLYKQFSLRFLSNIYKEPVSTATAHVLYRYADIYFHRTVSLFHTLTIFYKHFKSLSIRVRNCVDFRYAKASQDLSPSGKSKCVFYLIAKCNHTIFRCHDFCLCRCHTCTVSIIFPANPSSGVFATSIAFPVIGLE